jgi:hypothetical protein
MMISPLACRDAYEKMSYLELMKERDRLIHCLQKFETNELTGDRSDPEWQWHPGPDVRYQVNFEYLAELCDVMRNRYNQEYVFGYRTLQQDAEEYLRQAPVS